MLLKKEQKDQESNSVSFSKTEDKETRILRLKQQIAASVWIQALALISEAVNVTKLFYLEDEEPGSLEILNGVWIQAIGQLIEAIGVSHQILSEDTPSLLIGQRTAITGDWLQSIGAAIEAVGGEKTHQDAIRQQEDGFVP